MSTPTPPVTGTPDIDWLRSVTDTRVTHRSTREDDTQVQHTAYFGIRPETVPDVVTPYTRTDERFRPEFATAEWTDGKLSKVTVSGNLRRRRNGGVSDKVQRRREYTSHWTREQGTVFDYSKLPAAIDLALRTYELAVAVATSGARQ